MKEHEKHEKYVNLLRFDFQEKSMCNCISYNSPTMQYHTFSSVTFSEDKNIPIAIVRIMAGDGLATSGARASPAMILT